MSYIEYFRIRKLAIILTLIFLVVGSIVYFGTGMAERNNEMMYKKVYGQNATLDDVYARGNSNIGVDTSQEGISGKQILA